MNRKERRTARRMQGIAVSACLCLLAVGAGVTYRAFLPGRMTTETSTETSTETGTETTVTAVQSETMAAARLAKKAEKAKVTEQKAEPATETKQTAEIRFSSPLTGETEILLPYSSDHAIYDPTLAQYRTNTTVSLAAEQGAEVQAAADGVVREVKKDARAGNVVTIAHGENQLTTYGQLADAVAVEEGESVTQGQTIGVVAAPTKYGVALGTHLDFAMEKNGEPQNPTGYLEKEE